MSRTIPSSLLSVLGNAEIEPFYAVEMQFDSGTMRIWTGYGDKSFGGNTYTGTGNLLQIEGLEETSDLSAQGTTLTLNGLDSTIITYALTEDYQGRLAKIFWGVNGVSDVIEVFSGYMDTMTIQDEGQSSTIQLTLESRLITLERPSNRRYTAKSHAAVRAQKGLTGDDSFFDWVTQLQDKRVPWGREVNANASSTTTAGLSRSEAGG